MRYEGESFALVSRPPESSTINIKAHETSKWTLDNSTGHHIQNHNVKLTFVVIISSECLTNIGYITEDGSDASHLKGSKYGSGSMKTIIVL